MMKHKFSLKIHITTLFLSLILVLGGLLAWFNFTKASEILINTTDKLFHHLSDDITASFQTSYLPVLSNITFIAETNLPNLTDYSSRKQFEPALLSLLDSNPHTAAISLGYPNGDYFIIRTIVSEYMKEKFDAPDNAKYMVDHIESAQPIRQIERHFLSKDHSLMGNLQTLNTDYNPTIRPWFTHAKASATPVTTEPYLFYFIGKLGITLSYYDKGSGAVIAADITLDQLSKQLNKEEITPNTTVLIIDGKKRLVAYKNEQDILIEQEDGQLAQASIKDIHKPEVEQFLSLISSANSLNGLNNVPKEINKKFDFDGVSWVGRKTALSMSDNQLSLIVVTPVDELLTEAKNIRTSSTLITVIILFLALPLTWLLANRVSRPLVSLTREANRIEELDFKASKPAASFVLEIDKLASSIDSMRSTINRFITLVNTITSEKDHNKLLETVTEETRLASMADIAAIYLFDSEQNTLTEACANYRTTTDQKEQRSDSKPHSIANQISVIHNSITKHRVESCNITCNEGSPLGLIETLIEGRHITHAHLVSIPLEDRQKEQIGIVVMLFEMEEGQESLSDQKISFVKALSGFCAESLEKNRLYQDQKQLLESFIKLIAGAIDAKSPYTGGHCQRVPELAKTLTRAACEDTRHFKDFSMNEDQWEALHIASWLHDCGKVTTPEYVVDKATRLETIYNRIHEIRTRFEVLKRDAELDHQRKVIELLEADQLTEPKKAELSSELQQILSNLDEEFTYIAECNSGDKFMDQESIEKLNQIAQRTWQRTLSDRLGLAWEEKQRKALQPEPSLPATECILSDRYDHLIAFDKNGTLSEGNQWGFKMQVPSHKFNLGEIYNLSAKAGTLTPEERFIINDHIVQTIVMLDKLPFPKHLKGVPSIAGNHHEKIDGTGYPRKLKGEDMCIPSKVMAIADIFEALTASDRPYKEAKPLSAALKIMHFMAKDSHIDKDLFNLFIEQEVYMEYATSFLAEKQIDAIDKTALMVN